MSTRVNRRRRPLTLARLAVLILEYGSLIVFSVLILLPLWSVIVGSLKSPREYLTTNKIVPPQNWFNFSNYQEAIQPAQANGITIGGAYLNTALVLVCSLVLLILFGTMVAFVLNRFKFRGKLLILLAYGALVAIPGILTPISTFQVLNVLGLTNTRWALVVLYSGADIVSLLIFIQFLRGISTEIDDSARIEGANYFQIFFRLILPMLAPAITTVVILRSVGIYNDFVLPFLYVNKLSESTVSMMLFNMAGFNSGTTEAVLLAAVVLVILPTLIGFFFVQKYIYAGITNGSVKG